MLSIEGCCYSLGVLSDVANRLKVLKVLSWGEGFGFAGLYPATLHNVWPEYSIRGFHSSCSITLTGRLISALNLANAVPYPNWLMLPLMQVTS